MNKILGKHNLPGITQNERKKSNNTVFSTETEFIIKHLRNKRRKKNSRSRFFLMVNIVKHRMQNNNSLVENISEDGIDSIS